MSWQTNDDDSTSRSNIFGCLLERLLVDGDQDDGVWPETILGGFSDVLGDVTGFSKVDKRLHSWLARFRT